MSLNIERVASRRHGSDPRSYEQLGARLISKSTLTDAASQAARRDRALAAAKFTNRLTGNAHLRWATELLVLERAR
jgi:hypothetical protein